MAVNLIAAVALNGAIGRGNSLLWRIREDLAFFKATTIGHPVIMGRKTWESLGRPLPGRLNIVVSSGSPEVPETVLVTNSLEAAMSAAADVDTEVFIIGGGQLYAAAMKIADAIFITRVFDSPADADTFFPAICAEDWTTVSQSEIHKDEKSGIEFRFEKYLRK